MNLYLYDPVSYYKQYILGENFMEELKRTNVDRWEKIILGTIFQEAWQDPRINWRRKLKDEGFTSNKERIIATALKDPKMIRLPVTKCELTFRAEYKGIPILIKVDGWDENQELLLENKFGNPRGQEQVDQDNQISFYNLGLKLATGKKPKRNILQSVNDRTGKVDPVETTRSQSDLDHVGDLILMAAEGITNGVWEK